jgi:hypothetical protein
MLHGIVSGAAWFTVFLVVHILWLHMVQVERCAKLILGTFACCLAGHLGTAVLANYGVHALGVMILQMCHGSLVMGCLFILYMPFYYTIARSLSVQTLIVLADAPGATLCIDELMERFASKTVVAGRLSVMVTNGYLAKKDGGYCVTKKGYAIARFFAYLKEIWGLGPGG